MEEYEKRADELEQEADELGEKGDRVEGEIADARSDFEAKLGDAQAPGLLEEEAAAPGGTGEDEDEGGDAESSGSA
ncbi:MAG: hypothetical protein QOJ57_1376 [Thermoleophilaceae bacterium]|jgi:hypothetical protein|nr:hypothetical protein [Thermoleophilaceae bacterium]